MGCVRVGFTTTSKDNIEGIVLLSLGERDEPKRSDNKEKNFLELLNVANPCALCISVLR